jgi:protease IV
MKNKACCWILIIIGGLIILSMVGMTVLVTTVASAGSHKVPVKENSYLVFDMTGTITEYRAVPRLEFFAGEKPATLNEATRALKAAATDPRIVGVVLRPMGIGGFSEIRELRQALTEFKQSKKPVYAYLEVATDRDYYLASIADTVVVSPSRSAGLSMMGLGISSTYLARTFDKLGLKFHVLHVGQYKGAYENLASDSMSAPLRESLQTLLDDMYGTYSKEMSESRPGLSPDTVNSELLHGRKILIVGKDVVSKGFADMAMDWGDLRQRITRGDKFNSVGPVKYLKSVVTHEKGRKEIAVVYAEGAISYSTDRGGPIDGGEGIHSADFVKTLRDIREDSSVVGVVLRVNSPGGSALASEIILQEIIRLKAKKPVVVSMGNVAASGGYYISCLADRIIAQPNTITGSIGVVSVFPSAEELFKKIGARVETVEKGKWAQYFRVDKDLTPEQQSVLTEYMDGVYDEFVEHVAEGRKLTVDQVKASAAGRVWTGNQALDRKLVDELGGLNLAIQRAKELAKVGTEPVRVRTYPRERYLFTFFMEQLNTSIKAVRSQLLFTPEERQLALATEYLTRFLTQREFVQAVLPIETP